MRFDIDQGKIIFIQPQPFDFTGHVDGLIRFIDDSNVLISDFRREKKWYQDSVQGTLKRHKLEPILMPIAYEYSSKSLNSAVGIYMNYLQVGDLILFPIFNKREDEEAFCVISKAFPDSTIFTINCKDLAKEGGILNCVSWSI